MKHLIFYIDFIYTLTCDGYCGPDRQLSNWNTVISTENNNRTSNFVFGRLNGYIFKICIKHDSISETITVDLLITSKDTLE